MGQELVLLIAGCAFGFYMAWHISANDVANARASAVGAMVANWVVSPLFSLAIGFGTFKIIVRLILSRKDPGAMALQLSPLFLGSAVFVVILSLLFKTPLGKSLQAGLPVAPRR